MWNSQFIATGQSQMPAPVALSVIKVVWYALAEGAVSSKGRSPMVRTAEGRGLVVWEGVIEPRPHQLVSPGSTVSSPSRVRGIAMKEAVFGVCWSVTLVGCNSWT